MSEFQFRFCGDEREILAIFKKGNISKHFEESFNSNEKFLWRKISTYRDYILLCMDEEKALYSFYSDRIKDILSHDNLIISQFKKDVQRHIVWLAISRMFSNAELDIEKTIINLLDENIIRNSIDGKTLVLSICNVMRNYSSYRILEEKLMNHFFNER